MGTRSVERIRPSLALFVWIFIGVVREPESAARHGGAAPLAGARGGVRLAVQVLGRLGGDLCDVQSDILLLSAAFDGHGHMIRCLNGIEDLLAALRIVQRRCR